MGLYNSVTGFRRAHKRRGLQPEQKKCFKTSYSSADQNLFYVYWFFNPFAPEDFAEKRVLKLVEWFSGYCRAIKS